MRKIIILTGTCIAALVCVLLFNCEDPEPPLHPPPPPPVKTNMNGIEGHWTAVYALRRDYTDRKDLTEYFKDFQVTIDEGMAICYINGSEAWRAIKAWENNCTVFMKFKDRNTMLFDIIIASNDGTSNMTAIIRKEEPGFSFLPEKWNTGDYIVTFAR